MSSPYASAPSAVVGESLPPLVEGKIQGEVVMTVRQLAWDPEIVQPDPSTLELRLLWWGQQDTTVLKPFARDGADTCYFPIKCSRVHLDNYLLDSVSIPSACVPPPFHRCVSFSMYFHVADWDFVLVCVSGLFVLLLSTYTCLLFSASIYFCRLFLFYFML